MRYTGGSDSRRRRIRTKSARQQHTRARRARGLSFIEAGRTHPGNWSGRGAPAELDLVAVRSAGAQVVLVPCASRGKMSILCWMLMLRDTSSTVARAHIAHVEAIHSLRAGDLGRQCEGEKYGDNARNTDAVSHHASKLRSASKREVGETPLSRQGTSRMRRPVWTLPRDFRQPVKICRIEASSN